MSKNTLVSILVPIRNEEAYIERCIQAILSQDHPAIECWIIDGMSTDRTRSLLVPFLEKYRWIHLCDNPEQTAPHAMNYGLEVARGDVIIRVDGHCEIAPDYVSTCLRLLDETGADCVGGPLVNRGETPRAEAIALAMSSPFGVGNARFRYSQKPAWVDTLAFGAYRKTVFEKIGHFNPDLTRNQDDEFNYRLRAAGCRIYLSPEIRAVYYTRGTYRQLWKQYHGYGFWKFRVMRDHPGSTQIRHLVPGIFAMGLLGGLLSSGTRRGRCFLTLMLLPYTLLALIMGIKRTAQKPKALPEVLLSFPILHLAYGVGFWQGLVKQLRSGFRS